MNKIILLATLSMVNVAGASTCLAVEVCSKIAKDCFVTMEDCRAVGGHRAYSSGSPTGHDCHHEKLNPDGTTTFLKYSGDGISEDPQREADESDALLSRGNEKRAGE